MGPPPGALPPPPGALPLPPGGGQPYPGAAPYPGGYQPYGPMAMVNPFDSKATTVMVLGILSLVLCPVLGPIAWIQGNSLKREAESAGYPEPGSSKAGRICGIIASVLLILVIVFYGLAFALAFGSSSSGF